MRYSTGPEREGGISRGKILSLAAVALAGGAAAYAYQDLFSEKEPIGPIIAEIEFEAPRKHPKSKEENRDLVSSQHTQLRKSWENPGVYAWGSNTGKVVAPDSTETVIKAPRRIPYFDNMLLRDLKMDKDFGVAVTQDGDLVQWGIAFSKTEPLPVVTLKGKDITKITLSRDRIIALAKDGSVFSIPVSKSDQASGVKESSSTGIWSSTPSISYRILKPVLALGEKVKDIKSGLEHCLLLTSKGRVFSAASSSEGFPSKGQLGVRGLTWATRPDGPYDQPHEISELKGIKIKQIAAGDHHSLALDNDGQVFGWGDNSTGQLGVTPDISAPSVEVPKPLAVKQLYIGTGMIPSVNSIAAGGANSYFAVNAAMENNRGSVADTWACGEGIHGSLGSGKWTHISEGPTKIKNLSGLREFDEKTNSVRPIHVKNLSVGSTHAAAVLDNATSTATNAGSEYDTNYGADVLWWGGNENYQLGTGKRSNVATPIYIPPLESDRSVAKKDSKKEEERFQIAAKNSRETVDQRVECGRHVSAVYSAA
jgi:alpha-tubulin suppressor-like RCC1 family protein